MKEIFGALPNGEIAHIYTISCGNLTARITDLGATLVSLLVPDAQGNVDDIVLGYDSPAEYLRGDAYLGATIGRTANRIRNGSFILNNKTVVMEKAAIMMITAAANQYKRSSFASLVKVYSL